MMKTNAQHERLQRRKLPHEVPSWVGQGARHFITINCAKRGGDSLLQGDIAERLLESGLFYEKSGCWYLWLVVIMPDHLHLIATFDLQRGIKMIMSDWKRYQAIRLKIDWQPDYFEHRLRDDAEFNEKASYIRMNPVRKGLVKTPEEWRFVIDRGSPGGLALPHGMEIDRGSPGGLAPPRGTER